MKTLSTLALCLGCFAVLICAAIPASYASTVGPEVQIGHSFQAAADVQDSVSIAASPNGYLLVWKDARSGIDSDIFGCRLSLSGQVLDMRAITISVATGDQSTPAVTWDGVQYVVAWADKREGISHIYGARVSATGEVLDPQGISISGSTGLQSRPQVASDGDSSLIVWEDIRSTSYDIYCRQMNTDGVLTRLYGISTRTDNEEAPDIAFNGSTYLVVWEDLRNTATTGTDIYGCRVSAAGVRTGSDILISCTSAGTVGVSNAQQMPRLCGVGSDWMVVWQDFRANGLAVDIYGARVSSSGTVYDKGGIPISTAIDDQEMPSVGYDGSKILVTWRHNADRLLKGIRLSSAGAILDANTLSISTSMSGSSGIQTLGANNKFMVCWSTLAGVYTDVMFTSVTDGGVSQTPLGSLASYGQVNQEECCVVDNGTEYVAAWAEQINGSWDILAARISHEGALLTTSPINLTSTIAGHQRQPSIAWNGTKYLMAWQGNETYSSTDMDIRGLLLDWQLARISVSPIVISNAAEVQAKPSVASNGTNFLVAWEDRRAGVSPDYYSDIFGALVTSSGAVTAISTAISSGAKDQNSPKAAGNGANYFVVWEDYRGTGPAVKGSRVTSTGTVQDTAGIAMPATSINQTTPSIIYGNGSYFVAWSDFSKISACRVSTAGALLDSVGITVNSGTKLKARPSACWDGSKYLVLWEDYRSSDAANSDLYSTTVSGTGIVSTSPATALISTLVPQYYPVAFMSGSAGMLFYTNFINFSDGLCCATLIDSGTQTVSSIVDVKKLPPGSVVSLAGKYVTGAFTGYFYIEDQNRTSGIKVSWPTAVSLGQILNVVGTISIVDGERQINASEVTAPASYLLYAVQPIGIRGDWLGGAALNSYTPGVTGGTGPNNLGLLVTTWGPVLSSGTGYFYIEGRPGVNVRVKSGNLTIPAVGKMVRVTGISTCETISGGTGRAILPRAQDDIVVMN